jgi:hypothetical protein
MDGFFGKKTHAIEYEYEIRIMECKELVYSFEGTNQI